MTDQETIRQFADTWLEASRNGDLATLETLMHPDILFLTPGREPFGIDTFRESFRAMQGNLTIDGKANVLEVTIDGDHAYAHTFLEITITPIGQSPLEKRGHILSVYKRTGDRWQLYRDANFVA